MKFYKVNYSDDYSSILAADNQARIRFIDSLRINGFQKSKSLFPEWILAGAENPRSLKISDMPAGGPGRFFSEKAFNVLSAHFHFLESIKFEIDGNVFYWVNISSDVTLADLESCTIPIALLTPSYTMIYSEDFVNLWKFYKFNGLDFYEYRHYK